MKAFRKIFESIDKVFKDHFASMLQQTVIRNEEKVRLRKYLYNFQESKVFFKSLKSIVNTVFYDMSLYIKKEDFLVFL